MRSLTRRRFVQTMASGSSVFLAQSAISQPAPPVPGNIRIRRDIYSLQSDGPEVTALKAGVSTMKSRPASDPTSWLFQANIHGTDDAVPDGASDVWNTCQHGNFFFLSWHRMYLCFFERILRASSGEADFALPYWNYSVPAQRRSLLYFVRRQTVRILCSLWNGGTASIAGNRCRIALRQLMKHLAVSISLHPLVRASGFRHSKLGRSCARASHRDRVPDCAGDCVGI